MKVSTRGGYRSVAKSSLHQMNRSPSIEASNVQNAEQVNIAGEGAQQTNVHQKTTHGKKAKQGKSAARPSIRLASAK